MKKSKIDLRKDRVTSDTIHVGIELELVSPMEGGCGNHDDDACSESRQENDHQHYESMSTSDVLRDHFGLTREQASQLESYFDHDQWVRHMMDDWYDDGCHDESDCSYSSGGNGNEVREEMESDLRALTGNRSIKVEEDSSIDANDDDETDSEVCWNYFISKETVKDNEKILKWLKNNGSDFNKSCGLHINLNNYLKVSHELDIPTSELAFLFDFVGKSRRTSNYCNNYGMSGDTKYSMIYNQGDRLEFRFFSPTLEAEKLNNYVVLAHTVYKRLAGVKAKLPKKVADYFVKKMMKVNELDQSAAEAAILRVNNLISADQYAANVRLAEMERRAAQLVERDNRELVVGNDWTLSQVDDWNAVEEEVSAEVLAVGVPV